MKSFELSLEYTFYALVLSTLILWAIKTLALPLWGDVVILNVGMFLLRWTFLEWRVRK